MQKRTLSILALLVVAVLIYFSNWHQRDPLEAVLEVPVSAVEEEQPNAAPLETDVPDFSQYTDVRDKKQAFFAFLAPIIEAENSRIEWQRLRLIEIYQTWEQQPTVALAETDQVLLERLADRYRVKFSLAPETEMFRVLIRRVDVVPETLVLVQAANESGWGTSRFALRALNFFGQWCFSEGCGLVPEQRNEGAAHEVRKFESVNASVRSYLLNINTHPAYRELRQLREQHRVNDGDIRALDLTAGLLSYSERGEEYVEELNAMIRVNRPLILDVFDDLKTDPEPQ